MSELKLLRPPNPYEEKCGRARDPGTLQNPHPSKTEECGTRKRYFFARKHQLACGPAARYRFGKIKLREMYPDNLIPRIALQSLGPWIPCHHSAFWVQHKHGIVSYAFHQKTIEIAVLGCTAAWPIDWHRRRSLMMFCQDFAPSLRFPSGQAYWQPCSPQYSNPCRHNIDWTFTNLKISTLALN